MPSPIGPSCQLAELLGDRYFEFQQSARLSKRLALKASPPLLMLPHQRWMSAKLKVLIVGQETLRWTYNPGEVGDLGQPIENFWDFLHAEHGVGAMWSLYRWYALGRAYSKLNSPFWRGFRTLSSAIGGCEDSGLWTNVFKVNVRGSVVQNCKAAEILALRRAQKGLLYEEISILKPDVVIFFSGPRYDSTIQCDFPDMEVSQFCHRLPKSAVGVVRAAGLPLRTIRAYHPEYLQRSRQLGILSEISRWATGDSAAGVGI
jgi:hypothetical protein